MKQKQLTQGGIQLTKITVEEKGSDFSHKC